MSLLTELLDEVRTYLQGNCTEDDLEDWIVGHLQPVLNSGDEVAAEIANEIDVSFVELGENIIDRVILKSRLAMLGDQHTPVS